MITTRELADGTKRYDARVRGSNGRVVTRSFPRRRDAERWHRDQCAARDAGTWVDPHLGRQRVDEWFEEWWPTRTELRPSTIARDESHYRNHIISQFGDLALSSIDYQLVTAWVATLRDRGLAPATVRRCHLLLSKLLAASVKARRLPRNPCEDTDNLPPIDRKEMRIVTADQLQLLADSMRQATIERLERYPSGLRLSETKTTQVAENFAVFVLVAGYGGLRLGELAGLRKDKIDPNRRTVRVDTSLIEVRGKLIEGRPKTTAGIRTVPLPRSVARRLCACISHLDAQDHVFTGAEGSPIRAGSFRSRFWAPALVRAELTGLRMHDLRHTAVSTWIAHGATAKQVQVWAGHSSVASVFDRYGHLFPGGEDPVMDSIDAAAAQLGDASSVESPDDHEQG
jgi:integrase